MIPCGKLPPKKDLPFHYPTIESVSFWSMPHSAVSKIMVAWRNGKAGHQVFLENGRRWGKRMDFVKMSTG